MTGRPPRNENLAHAAVGENRTRIRRLEAVRPAPTGGCCDVGYEYIDGLLDSNGGLIGEVISGSSWAVVGQAGDPDAPVQPPVGAPIMGHALYSIINAAQVNIEAGQMYFDPTWLPSFGFPDLCLVQPGAVVGHGRVSRPHVEADGFGQYSYGPPAVAFDLVAGSYYLYPVMMYDGTSMWGGYDGGGAYPEYTLSPWLWQDGDEISAHWHTFINYPCGD